MDLQQFLRLPHRFMWGGDGRPHHADPDARIYNDCTSFCATWAEMLTGIDPGEGLRGTYATAVGAQRIINSAGGIVPFFGARLEPIGFKRVSDKQDGDIGIIETLAGMDGDLRHIGAIAFGPLWATLGPSGVAAKKAEAIAGWRYQA